MRKRLPLRFIFVVSLLFYFSQPLNAQNPYEIFLDSLLRVLPLQKEDSIKALILINITRMKMGSAQNTGNWNEAIQWAKKSLNLSTKVNYQFGIGRSNMNLGLCWIQKGDYAEAIKYFYGGLNLSFKNGNKNLRQAAFSNLAKSYLSLGDDKEALKNFLLAYKTAEQLNNNGPEDVLQLAVQIAQTYAKMLNWEEALSWYQKAQPAGPELFYEGEVTLQIASVQMQMKRYDEALNNFRIAVQVFPARFDRKLEAGFKGMLGEWYQQLGEAYYKIGTLTKGSERTTAFNESINYLNKSLPLLTEGAGGKQALLNAYEFLKQSCEAINDYQRALHFSTLYISLKDSLYSKTTFLKLADQKVKYETEKAAVELKGKQEKERIQQDALRDKMLANQKLEEEKKLSEEKINHEKSMAEEKIKFEKSIAVERLKQEQLRSEKQQANNLLLMGLVFFAMISVFIFLYLRQRHEKKAAVKKAETIHQMAELELQSLRTQLNPHFMFNSLNSIQALIMKEQTDKSQSYLSRFARLLRMLLDNADKPFVSLGKEIELLQLYLSLEVLRVPDMQYSISTDPVLDTEQILIPNMILQPYVENAIWHGLSHKETDKQLQIRIFGENGTINYEIEDNGVGRKKAGELKSLFRKQHQSKGMELLSKRIELLNKEYSSVIKTEVSDVIENKEVAGTLVVIKVPLTLSQISQTKS